MRSSVNSGREKSTSENGKKMKRWVQGGCSKAREEKTSEGSKGHEIIKKRIRSQERDECE